MDNNGSNLNSEPNEIGVYEVSKHETTTNLNSSTE